MLPRWDFGSCSESYSADDWTAYRLFAKLLAQRRQKTRELLVGRS
jgi:hypothetical protein